MTAFPNSTVAPKFQPPAHCPVPQTVAFQNLSDPILPLWRAWRDSVRIEVEAGRERRQDDHYHQAWTARIRAMELLVSFPGSSAIALAARLHAAFHHAYDGVIDIEKRDPVYRAQVAVLDSLLPALPAEMAAEIERSLDGEG